ncbi:myelin and lymphocyte protein isoform X1 [Equus caballus]|uniref:myelin and lymphocyte protein isoform X1 n=1 Tax=Equus caballus TaxID=9796 RepID=UPI0038B2D920
MARPSGVRVFIKYPAFFFWELVLGGLVWILIASSLVPFPLTQGWVMFVSVFCFVGTTALLFWYMCGSDYEETSWVILDIVYHCFASMFYLSASILEALATNNMQEGSYFTYQHYLENIFATGRLLFVEGGGGVECRDCDLRDHGTKIPADPWTGS